MPTDDYRHGKLLPTPVTPSSTVCFTITIPNAVQYRAALFGQLNALGEWYTWDHPTDGTYCADCEEAAQLWRDAIANATFSDECGGSMSCDDVADCIENDPAVQNALAQQILSNPSNQTTVYQTSVYGAPLNAAQRSAPLASPPECDLDVLFAMCTAIIDQLHANNEDFLEILEVASNPTERARNVISAIPGIGLLPIDEAIEFINQMVEEIQENYDAQYTTSIRDELRCALFCAAKDAPDCIVTFDMLTTIFEDRLNYYLDPVNTVLAFVQYFVTSTWAGTTVVDIMTLCQVAFWREASNWLGVNIRTLQLVARLVIDNPDPDWEILCTECATPPVEDCYPFASSQHSFIPYFNGFVEYATYSGGNGFGVGYNPGIIKIRRADMGGTVVRVTGRFSQAVPSGVNNVVTAANYDGTGAVSLNDVDTAEFEITGLSLSNGLDIDLTFDGTLPVGFYLEEVCVELEVTP